MNSPFFSICMPVYNGAEFIAEAMQTVFDQQFGDWELVVIDNASTDRTLEIARGVAGDHPRVRVLGNPQNLGLRGNLNRCLEEARGAWIGILPADDGYRPHTLRTIYEKVTNREDIVLWAHTRIALGEGKDPDVIVVHKHATEFRTEEMAETLYLKGNVYGGLGNYFFRRSAVQHAGVSFFDGTVNVDTRFWIRILKGNPGCKAVYWPDVLSFMREHAEAYSLTSRRSDEWLVDLSDTASALSTLNWPFRARWIQFLRLLRCWIKYFSQLAPANRIPALGAIVSVGGRPFLGRQG